MTGLAAAAQNSTGSISLLSALAVAGGGCTTQKATGPCRGKARFSASTAAAASPAIAASPAADSDLESTDGDIYMLLLFTDGSRWKQLLAGRDGPFFARISVTYCIAAAGALSEPL